MEWLLYVYKSAVENCEDWAKVLDIRKPAFETHEDWPHPSGWVNVTIIYRQQTFLISTLEMGTLGQQFG